MSLISSLTFISSATGNCQIIFQENLLCCCWWSKKPQLFFSEKDELNFLPIFKLWWATANHTSKNIFESVLFINYEWIFIPFPIFILMIRLRCLKFFVLPLFCVSDKCVKVFREAKKKVETIWNHRSWQQTLNNIKW